IPNKNEQMIRYTGYYSNVCRGRRKKEDTCESDFDIEEDNNKGANKSWARLIKKIYEVDPLICPVWGVFDKNIVLKAFSAKTLPIFYHIISSNI
ncbi:MAG: hypothetical protein ACYCXO_12405, partial [Candidatus Humimicrobiaceae bacterium]